MMLISFDDCKGKGIVEIPYSCGSDYSGSMVERCNYETLKKELKRYNGIYELYGWYSGYGIGYAPSELTKKGKEKIADILDRLESYPCLDDDKVSMMEYDSIMKTFESDYSHELREYENDNGDIPESIVNMAREIVCQGIGDIAYPETGGVVYIAWEKVIEKINNKKIGIE